MSEKISRILMGIELIVIVLQLVLIFGYITLIGLVLVLPALLESFYMEGILALIVCFICWPPLISGIILMIIFIKNGSSGLRSARPYLWKLCTYGATLPIIGLIIAIAQSLLSPAQGYQFGNSIDFGVFDYFGGLAFALPLLIPYAHLLLEKKLRKEIKAV